MSFLRFEPAAIYTQVKYYHKPDKKMRAGTINSVSYDVLKHMRHVLRYGRDQEIVDFLT
jgi:hypothetical protein